MKLLESDELASVQIELTSRCNLKCQMCPLTSRATLSSHDPGAMSDVVWERVVEAGVMAGAAVVAGFGELLLNRDWLDRLAALDAAGVQMGLSTNGALLSPEKVAALVSLKNLRQINISVDSPDPAIYRAIRGGAVGPVLRGLKWLMAAMDDPTRVTVSSVMMERNVASLVDLPRILAGLGVRVYFLQGLVELNPRVQEEHLFLHDAMGVHLEAIRRACHEAGIELRLSMPQRLELELERPTEARARYHAQTPTDSSWTRQCAVPWEIPFVNKDGLVFPCCNASTTPDAIVGDLRQQCFSEVWRGDALRQFRTALLDGSTTPAVCRGCATAPWGIHPYVAYAAMLLNERSRLTDPRHVKLVVLNTGRATWTRATRLHVGTAAPRDHYSPFFRKSWLSPTRVGTFLEDEVRPGQEATFEFMLARPLASLQTTERFQLVVEGVCWLPGTRFEVATPAAGGRRLAARLVSGARGVVERALVRDLTDGRAKALQ